MQPENETNLKLTEATDPRMDALLDAALAAEAVPEGLNARIVAATIDDLPTGSSRLVFPGLLRFAAVLAMAVGLGVVLWSASGPASLPGQRLVVLPADPAVDLDVVESVPSLDALAARLDRLATVSDAVDEEQGWLDDQIDLVDLRFELVRTANDWPDEQEVIESTGTRYELDQMVDEMNLMF